MNKKTYYKWQVLEGVVNTDKEHIKVTYSGYDFPYAILQFGRCRTIIVQYFCGNKPWYAIVQKALSKIQEEIEYYMLQKSSANPWEYAVCRASKAADMYSDVRWALYPKYSPVIENIHGDIEKNDNPALLQFNIGEMHLHAEEYKEAIIAFNRCIEIDNTYSQAYVYRGIAFAHLGEFDLAINDCNFAIDIDPEYDYAYCYRGYCYLLQDMDEEAMADCNKAIELKPESAKYLGNRAHLYMNKSKYKLALRDFEKAIDIEPDHPDYYEGKAEAYLEMEMPGLATEAYEEAMAVDPYNILVFAKLAQLKTGALHEEH